MSSALPKRVRFLALFAALAAGPAFAQAPRAQDGSGQRPTGQRPPEDLVALDALLEEVRAAHDLPALAGAIVHAGEVVALGASGVRALGSEAKVTAGDRWHLGSCTKAMTATLAARLVEKRELTWSTTVGEAFPKLRKLDPAWKDVPIEWLLQNRGGAPGKPPRELWGELYARRDAPHEARRWFVERLLAAAPEVEPGTANVYSNQGFTIAGAMLEARARGTWEDLMRAEVFEPLGMTSAGFGPPGEAGRLDQPRGHRASSAVEPGPEADNPPAIGPAGTVHATIGDWGRFAAAHLAGARGESEFLSREGFARLHEAPGGQDYAMGWGTGERGWAGGKVLTHSGSNTMWYCVVWIAPAKDHAFLVACNSAVEAAPKACDAAIGRMIGLRKLE
jgi:CubicO group peptidase (beta-lactamase class C family)